MERWLLVVVSDTDPFLICHFPFISWSFAGCPTNFSLSCVVKSTLSLSRGAFVTLDKLKFVGHPANDQLINGK